MQFAYIIMFITNAQNLDLRQIILSTDAEKITQKKLHNNQPSFLIANSY